MGMPWNWAQPGQKCLGAVAPTKTYLCIDRTAVRQKARVMSDTKRPHCHRCQACTREDSTLDHLINDEAIIV
jgi:hypothetical protein